MEEKSLNLLEDLVERVKLGEQSYFEQIIENLQQPIFSYCCYLLGNYHEAQDAVQEIFIKAYQKIHLYRSNRSFTAWLYRIAYNHCINLIRRRNLVKFVPLLEALASNKTNCSHEPNYEESMAEVQELLKVLKPIDRSIIVLKVLHEKSFDEIGKIIEMKPASARKRFERAKKSIISNFETYKGGVSNEECSTRCRA